MEDTAGEKTTDLAVIDGGKAIEATMQSVKKRLQSCEARIDKALKFGADGLSAMSEIFQDELWKAKPEYETFDEYCTVRFNFTKARIYQLFDAYKLNLDLKEPVNEGVARVLKYVEPAYREEVLAIAKADHPKGRVTSKGVQKAADKAGKTRTDKKTRKRIPKAVADDYVPTLTEKKAFATFLGLVTSIHKVPYGGMELARIGGKKTLTVLQRQAIEDARNAIVDFAEAVGIK